MPTKENTLAYDNNLQIMDVKVLQHWRPRPVYQRAPIWGSYPMGPNSDDIVRVWDVWKIPRDDVTRLATERRHRAALKLVPKHHAWRQLGPFAMGL
jgi:hypothetical protein